ncbi:GntP family permease [Paenibacillus sp. BR2-3]|uniref:GntP family permease n=1 Tax=Paenibacillus sp. BR2-3 TaxID=3048494 RepID=UPI0039774671
MLLFIVVAAIVALLLMITWGKLNPFVALIITAIGTGLATGMPIDKIIQTIKDGMGGTLGFLAIVLGLGTMLGKMMAESGGAERIAKTLISLFGEKRVHWAMMVVGFIVGIPVFFQVGFVLLIPLVYTIARATGVSLIKIGVPLVAGLSVVHGLVPPHPAAMAAVGIFKADVGKTILYSLIVGLPTAIVAGPLYGKFIGKRIHKEVPADLAEQFVNNDKKELPGFFVTIFTILLPVFLMMAASIATLSIADKADPVRKAFEFIGDPVMSLLVSCVVSFFTLGFARGMSRDLVLKFSNDCLGPTASILLVIGAGGAFNKILLESGIGTAIADWASGSNISPIILGWLIAALIRVATGSATVSMMTAAGILAPIAATIPGTSLELLVLATGAGSLILSHFNDAGFWMIKSFFGMSVKETLMTWTVLETLIAVVALPLILLLNVFI